MNLAIFLFFLAHCDVTEAFEEDQIKNTIAKESKNPEAEVNEKIHTTLESLVLTDKNIPECSNENQNDTDSYCSISTEENVELDPNLGTLSTIQKSQNNVDEHHEVIKAEDVFAKNSELIAKINQELLNVDAFKNVNSNNQETELVPPEKVLFSQDTNGIKNQFSVLMTPPTGKKHAYKSRGYYLNF